MPPTGEPTTILQWLIHEFPHAKRQTFKEMVAQGRVRVNGGLAQRLSQSIPAGAAIKVLAREHVPRSTQSPSLKPLALVHEDDDLLVVDKPAGLLTSTVAHERRPTALAIVRRYIAARDPQAPVGLIHRLDRDAAGLLVFSKSHRAYKSLKTQFFHHSVDRVYQAIVHGIPSPKKGRIESLLIERADGTVRSTPHASGKSQRAITDYEVLQSKAGKSLVSVTLLTGRKHQIRVHLTQRGHPIVGDPVYGQDKEPQLQLRAIQLGFDHPATGKRMTFTSNTKLEFAGR